MHVYLGHQFDLQYICLFNLGLHISLFMSRCALNFPGFSPRGWLGQSASVAAISDDCGHKKSWRYARYDFHQGCMVSLPRLSTHAAACSYSSMRLSCGDPGLPIRNTRYAFNSWSHDQCVMNPHIWVDNRITSSIWVTNNKVTIGHMTKLDNATQGKCTSKQRIPSSVDDSRHAYYLTGNWLGDVPSSHRCHRNHCHLPRSLIHSLTKLIARDKAVSTFWIVLANHLKRVNWYAVWL
jgi:hypothetical protein